MSQSFSELANFVWSVTDLLRGDYEQADYGKVNFVACQLEAA